MATQQDILLTYRTDTGEVTQSLDDIVSGLEGVDNKIEETANGTKKIEGGLKATGKTGSIGFRAIGTAIKATGIGLLVGIVAKLVEQFTKTDTGAKILQGTMAVLGVVFEQVQMAVEWIIDNLVSAFTNPQQAVDDLRAGVERLGDWFGSLGDYIKNNFILLLQKMQSRILEARIAWNEFTGDAEEADALKERLESINEEIDNTKMAITEAAEEVQAPFVAAANFIKETVNTIVEQSKNAIAASNASIEAANRFAALQNRLLVENAQLTKQLEEQKKIAEDTTRAYDERKVALDAVNEANEQLVANALLEAQANENLISQQLSIASNDEDRRALQADLAAATAERIAREQEAEVVRLESAKLSRELDLEEVDRKKFINDAIRGLEIENIENEKEAELAALNLAEQTLLAELDAVRATEEQKQLVRDEFAKKRSNLNKTSSEEAIKLAKEEAEKRQIIADKAFSVLNDLATLFSKTDEANAKKNFKIQKAIGISQAAINTGLAVTAALTAGGNPIKLATGAQFVEAGIAAVAGAAQIAAIARTKFSSGSTPSPPGDAGGGATGNIPQSPQLDLGFLGAGAGQTGFRSYVIASEVSNSQQANQRINDQASLVG